MGSPARPSTRSCAPPHISPHLPTSPYISRQAFYSELRTRQQLGYIVQCAANEVDGVRGLVFIVQSKVQPPPVVEERVQGFLRLFRGTLLLLDDKEVQAATESLAAQFTDVDNRLDSQAGRLWGECARRRYDFERPWRSAAK